MDTIEQLQQLVVAGFDDWEQIGDVRVTTQRDLRLFTYTHEAQFNGRWNFFERISRGLIMNAKSGEIVARPFDKFFNWGESGRKAPYTAHIANVYEKMDGSLGILYRENGAFKIATKGSFTGEQAVWATAHLNEHYDLSDIGDEWTLLFEIIYPDNRIVVDYAGREALVLLAARNRFTGNYMPFYPDLYDLASTHGFDLPNTQHFNNVTDILAMLGGLSANEEGFVAEFSNGDRYKFKGDDYVEVHRFISNLSFKNTLGIVQTGQVGITRQVIPTEFLGEFNQWVAEIEATVRQTKAEVDAAFAVAPKYPRKAFAHWVQEHHPRLTTYLFARLDKKEIEPLIYKLAFVERLNELR